MQWFVKKCSRVLIKIVSLVDWSYDVNAIHQANCDMISCQFMINQILEFKTPASLYDYTCVVIVKSIYYNKYHIRGPETSWFLAPFSTGEGLLSGCAVSDAKKKEVYLILF